jgi:methyl-accepting chemotaxis protein
MSRKDEQHQKRIYFIQKGFQTKMILRFVSLLVVGAVISSMILYFFAGDKLESSYYEAHSSIKSMWDILGTTVLATNFISLVIISFATVYVVLFLSHKIAGPLYKLEKNINEISNGNLDLHVYFREGDQIQSVGTALENMVNKLSERVKVISQVSTDISTVVERLQALKEKESVSGKDMDEMYKLLSQSSIKLNSELEKFQTRK